MSKTERSFSSLSVMALHPLSLVRCSSGRLPLQFQNGTGNYFPRVFDGIQKAIAADRYVFFSEFFKNFYNTDLLLGKRVSEKVIQASWNIAAGASSTASLACVPTWHKDFRQDLARMDVPTLVIHGDDDRIVPFTAAGQRTTKLLKRRTPPCRKGKGHTASFGLTQTRSMPNC